MFIFRVGAFVSLITILAVGAWACNPRDAQDSQLLSSTQNDITDKELFDRISEAYKILEELYIDPLKLDPDNLSLVAFESIRGELPEETVYLSSEAFNECQTESRLKKESLQVFDCVFQAYSASSMGSLSTEKTSDLAIKGMVDSLGDRYTAFVPQKHFALRSSDLQGQFEGIGAHVQEDLETGHFSIVSVIEGSPALNSGLQQGDRITAVDGEDTVNFSLEELVLKVRGEKGSTVILTIARDIPGGSEPEEFPVTVIRDVIETPSVSFKMLEDSKFGYIRISSFALNTDDDTVEAVSNLKLMGATGIIIDLRNNPGGLLDTTVNTSALFLPEQAVITRLIGREVEEMQEFRGSRSRGEHFEVIPLVVLVNQFSASGSEVFSGALQDYDRAYLIGEKTFGKGSVTSIQEMRDGSGIYVTSARWYTPDMRLIEGEGILPDKIVPAPYPPMSDKDVQLEAALENLASKLP